MKANFHQRKENDEFTKRQPVATTFLSGTNCHHFGIGIPGYTFGSSIQV